MNLLLTYEEQVALSGILLNLFWNGNNWDSTKKFLKQYYKEGANSGGAYGMTIMGRLPYHNYMLLRRDPHKFSTEGDVLNVTSKELQYFIDVTEVFIKLFETLDHDDHSDKLKDLAQKMYWKFVALKEVKHLSDTEEQQDITQI